MKPSADMPVTAIGIDVGGTKIAGGVAHFPQGQRRARRVIPTEASRGGTAVLAAAVGLARELAAEAKSMGHQVDAVGLGVCELVDRDGRLASANCLDWRKEPVQQEFESIAPLTIEADVRAAALAESLFGAAQAFRTFLYVTIGTGISCCLFIDGQPYVGAHGFTGTMASSALSLPCEGCGQGTVHTLEEIASGPALVARFNAAQGNAASGQEVVAAAARGNPIALQTVRNATLALGSQLGLLVNVLDPEAVVLGGGLGLSEGVFSDQLIPSIRQHIWSDLNRELPILRASTGADAGWLGAAAHAARSARIVRIVRDGKWKMENGR